MQKLIAIDPGAKGGIAYIDEDGIVQATPMPNGMTAQIDMILELSTHVKIVVLEKVGTYVSGNSGPAACKFARHCGHIEAALYSFGIPVEQVAPGVWQRGLGKWPKDKSAKKRAIKEEMARRYPHLNVTLKTGDAIAILTWKLAGRN